MKKVFTILIILVLLVGCSKEIKEPKTLIMATEATFEPYEFYDGDKIIGIDVEIANAVAEKLGMKLEVIDVAFDSIIAGVQAGKYDIGMAGITVSNERKEKVNFSNPYATGIQVIIINEGSPITCVDDLFVEGNNYVIGTQAGTTGFLYATWDIQDEGLGTVVSFQRTTDAAQALKANKVDCIILDNEPAKAIVRNYSGLTILATEYAVEDYAIAINKSNTELTTSINNALVELTANGTIKNIIDKYIGE